MNDQTEIHPDYAAFRAHAQSVLEHFEKRRQRYLKKLMFRSAVALVLLLSFPVWFSLLMQWDGERAEGLSAVGLLVIELLAGIVLVLGIILFAVLPLFRYRTSTTHIGGIPGIDGLFQHKHSLKSKIFGELLGFFGTFSLHGERRITLRQLHHAPALPEFDDMQAEDYIKGRIADASVEMMEVDMLNHQYQDSLSAFHGLMVLVDFSDPDIKLRGTFEGKTVLIEGRNSDIHDNTLMPFSLGDESFQAYCRAYSNQPGEAKKLLSIDFIRSMLTISDRLRNAKKQTKHVDDKLAYSVARIAESISDAMSIGMNAGVNWIQTGSTKNPTIRNYVPPQPPSDDSSEMHVIRHHSQCAFYDDKMLLLIPYTNDLFEPDPIFRPPLHEEDMELVFTLMSNLSKMIDEVRRVIEKDAL